MRFLPVSARSMWMVIRVCSKLPMTRETFPCSWGSECVLYRRTSDSLCSPTPKSTEWIIPVHVMQHYLTKGFYLNARIFGTRGSGTHISHVSGQHDCWPLISCVWNALHLRWTLNLICPLCSLNYSETRITRPRITRPRITRKNLLNSHKVSWSLPG